MTTEEKVTLYDTLLHIKYVNGLLLACVTILLERAASHDFTKLEDPELATFVEYTPKLANSTYGSEEYKQFLREMKPALDHHYATHRHHPEHFKNGVNEMTLIDVLEMLCDWKAATYRHNDGDIQKSIAMNADRFELSEQLMAILKNTVEAFGW